MSPDKRIEFFRRLRRANPEPRSELAYASPIELLVAVILSAQPTDKSVNLATAKLFPAANTPAAIAALGEAGLIEYIKTIGLFRMKATPDGPSGRPRAPSSVPSASKIRSERSPRASRRCPSSDQTSCLAGSPRGARQLVTPVSVWASAIWPSTVPKTSS